MTKKEALKMFEQHKAEAEQAGANPKYDLYDWIKFNGIDLDDEVIDDRSDFEYELSQVLNTAITTYVDRYGEDPSDTCIFADEFASKYAEHLEHQALLSNWDNFKEEVRSDVLGAYIHESWDEGMRAGRLEIVREIQKKIHDAWGVTGLLQYCEDTEKKILED